MRRAFAPLSLIVALGCLSWGCGSGTGSDPASGLSATCLPFIKRFSGCPPAVLNSGTANPPAVKQACADLVAKLGVCQGASFDPVASGCGAFNDFHMLDCEFFCDASAACADLEDVVCDFDTSNAARAQCLATCQMGCDGQGTASGEVISQSDVCNGIADCSNGQDEGSQACGIACDLGGGVGQLEAFELCDGFADCVDGSDEAGCPEVTCDSGETIPAAFECDDIDDCVDASDEAGCPPNPFDQLCLAP